MPSAVAEQLRSSSDAFRLLDATDVVVHATPAARLALRTDHLVGLDLPALDRVLGTRRLDTDRSAGPHLVSGRSAAGDELAIVVLPSDMGLCLFVAAVDPRGPGARSAGAVLMDKVLATVRDAVLVTVAEPIDAGGPIIVYANEALAQHTGYDVDELLGRSPRILQGPGTDRAELDRVHASLQEWQPVTVELLNYRKDGSEFWVEIDIVPLADPDGWITHWVSVQRLVTRRKRDDAEKEKRRAFVQAILDSLPAQTAMLDLRGRIVAVNQPWRDFWMRGDAGPEPDWSTVNYLEVCRRSADHDEGQDGMDALAAYDGIRAVLTGEQQEYTLDYRCPIDGVVHWFTLHARHVDRGATGVVVTHTDITDHRNAEDALRHQATHDPLTGVGNLHALRTSLAEQLLEDRVQGTTTALVLVDLDRFRAFGQEHGPHVGDVVLVELTRRLQSLVRQGDTVARTDDDEFALLLGRLPAGWSPDEFAGRVMASLRRPYDQGDDQLRVTASVGIATTATSRPDAEAVRLVADRALSAAKRAGGDRWVLADGA